MVPDRMRWHAIPLLLVFFLAAAGCSGSGGDTTVTTTTGDGGSSTTSAGGSNTTSPPPPTASTSTRPTGQSTSTIPPPEVPEYSIESRTGGVGGDTVVILLEPGTYSDLDLEIIVIDVVERFAPVATVHLVDESAAVPLVLEPLSTLAAADRAVLDQHYFARLEEGFRLIYLGPFSTVGEVILGS